MMQPNHDNKAFESYDERRKNILVSGAPKLLPAFLVESKISKAPTMPTAVYSLVWSFLLDLDGSNKSKDSYSVDLKTISSFMLVSKTAKEEFHACNGWNQCVIALKQEASFKREIIWIYQQKGAKLTDRGFFHTPLSPDELSASRAFLESADRMRKVNARLVRIQSLLLRKTCLLAGTSYIGKSVSGCFVYNSTLEQSIRAVEREVNIQPALHHILGLILALLVDDDEE